LIYWSEKNRIAHEITQFIVRSGVSDAIFDGKIKGGKALNLTFHKEKYLSLDFLKMFTVAYAASSIRTRFLMLAFLS